MHVILPNCSLLSSVSSTLENKSRLWSALSVSVFINLHVPINVDIVDKRKQYFLCITQDQCKYPYSRAKHPFLCDIFRFIEKYRNCHTKQNNFLQNKVSFLGAMHHFSVFFVLVFCVFLCNKKFNNVTQKRVFRMGILSYLHLLIQTQDASRGLWTITLR